MLHPWEQEYRNPKLITGADIPIADIRRFYKWLKKSYPTPREELQILDIGCGIGRHAHIFAEKGATVSGIDISATAIYKAREQAKKENLNIDYICGDISHPLPYPNKTFDIILDSMCSHALMHKQRLSYIQELLRVLKPGGIVFLRTLCLDGDNNAKNLLEKFPGPGKNMYIFPGLGFIETVFTREDIENLYGPYFDIQVIEKKQHYTSFEKQSYKRNFWTIYMTKKLGVSSS